MTTETKDTPATQKTNNDTSLAIVSMVLGIISLTGPGLFLGIPAIITGAIAMKKNQQSRGMGLTGIITGAVSTFLSIVFCIFLVFMIMFSASLPADKTPLPEFSPSYNESMQHRL